MSSPTFFGDRPRGPIFGAKAEDAPTSPPVALKVLHSALKSAATKSRYKPRLVCLPWSLSSAYISLTSFGSNFGATLESEAAEDIAEQERRTHC